MREASGRAFNDHKRTAPVPETVFDLGKRDIHIGKPIDQDMVCYPEISNRPSDPVILIIRKAVPVCFSLQCAFVGGR